MTDSTARSNAVPDAVDRPVSPWPSRPASDSSSADRERESAMPVAAVAASPAITRPPRSIDPGSSAITATAPMAVKPAVGASDQRTRARATVRFRQTNASPRMPNATTRVRIMSPSGCGGAFATPKAAAAATAPSAIAVFWRSARASRRTLASTMPAPVSASPTETMGTAPPPVATCASAVRAANSAASMTLRPTSSTAIVVCALARRTSRSDPQAVDGHVRRVEPCPHGLVQLVDRHRKDPMVRSAEGEERPGQMRPEDRRDAHQRRAPREPAALAQEHRFWGVRGVRSQPREDLQAPRERTRTPAERRPRPLVGHVVDPVRDEAHLPSRIRGEPDELRGRGDHDLGGLGIGLDPVLVVRRDVEEEHRIEARSGLVHLRLQRAEPRRCLPVDLLARISAPMLAHATEAQRIRQEAALRCGLGQRSQRGRWWSATLRGIGYATIPAATATSASTLAQPSQSPLRRRIGPGAEGPPRVARRPNVSVN